MAQTRTTQNRQNRGMQRCGCKSAALAKGLSKAVLAPNVVFVAHPTIPRAMMLRKSKLAGVKARGKATKAKGGAKGAKK